MSSSGPSTGLASRSSLPGWWELREPLLRVSSSLDEVKALHEKVHNFEKTTDNYLKVLNAANEAAQKMTTHADADAEVAALRERHVKVKAVSDEWVKEVDILLKEWVL